MKPVATLMPASHEPERNLHGKPGVPTCRWFACSCRVRRGMLRIKHGPVPRSQTVFMRSFTLVYCLLLPFAFARDSGRLCTVIVGLFAWLCLGVQDVADSLERPFGLEADQLQMDLFTDIIYNQCVSIWTRLRTDERSNVHTHDLSIDRADEALPRLHASRNVPRHAVADENDVLSRLGHLLEVTDANERYDFEGREALLMAASKLSRKHLERLGSGAARPESKMDDWTTDRRSKPSMPCATSLPPENMSGARAASNSKVNGDHKHEVHSAVRGNMEA